MKPSVKQLADVIYKKLSSKNLKGSAKQIAAYLVKARRTTDLDAIMRLIIKKREDNGLIEINATSAHKLSDAIKKEAARLFGAKAVVFNEKIDPNAGSGVRLESSSKRLDATAIRRLNMLKRTGF